MSKFSHQRRAVWSLCCLVGFSIELVPLHAESTVVNLGDPNEVAPIARIYEVGTYAYDPQASAEYVSSWSHAADVTRSPVNISPISWAKKAPTGDIDGDGFDDLIIPGFFHTHIGMNPVNPISNPSMTWLKRGAFWVVYGGEEFGRFDQYLDRDLGNGPNTLVSFSGSYFSDQDQMERPFYMWGYEGVECADMNQDGLDDIVILAHGKRPVLDPNVPDQLAAMSVRNIVIIYGRSSLRGDFVDLDDADDRAAITIIEFPREEKDAYEYSSKLREDIDFAIGDFNADAFPDIAIGKPWRIYAPDNSAQYHQQRGSVEFLFGGVLPVGEVLSFSDLESNSRTSEILGVLPDSAFGRSLVVGDLNGDGIDDLLVSYADTDQGSAQGGSMVVLYGDPGIQSMNGLLEDLPFSTAPTYLIGINRRSGQISQVPSSLATGDINTDGFDDLILGHTYGEYPDEVDWFHSNGGRTVSIHGSQTLPGSRISLGGFTGDQGEIQTLGIWGWVQSPTHPDPTRTIEVWDDAGSSVAFADISGDGMDDWLIWASRVINPTTVSPFLQGFAFGRCYVLKSPVQANSIDLHNDADVRVEGAVYPGWEPTTRYFPAKWSGLPFSGGDLNRDGFAEYGNCSQFGRAPDRIELTRADIWGSFEIVMGQSTPGLLVAQAVERFKPGNAPARGFGGRTSPVLRAHLSFADGDGPSPVTAMIMRSNNGLANANVNAFAQVHWKFDTTRINWTEAQIRFQYTDAEINGLSENALKLFQASSKSGPWTEVPSQVHDQRRNEFSATVSDLGYFALGDTRDLESPSVTLASNAAATVTGPIEIQVTLSEPVNMFGTDDIATTNSSVTNVTGGGTRYQFSLAPFNQGEFSARVTAGSLEDVAGNPCKASNTISRTLDSVGPTVVLSSSAPSIVSGEIVVVTALISEVSEDFTSADISADNAVVAAFTGSGKSYTFCLIPQSAGKLSARVNAAKCVDALENPNSASNTIERTFEQTSLRLVGPDGGERFEPNENVTVTWQSSGNVGSKVCIELWRRGELVKVLSKKTANDGTEVVTLPSKLATKSGYSIRIYSMKNHGIADISNKPFRVIAPS